ncbi:hypothetical protein D3C72_1131430 [compost metagenome]
MGLAHSLPGLDPVAGRVAVDPPEAGREPLVQAHEGRRQGVQDPAEGQLHEVAEPEAGADRPRRSDGRSGGHLVHRSVLRPLLPGAGAAGRRLPGLHHAGRRPAAGLALLHLLGLAVGQGGTQADHPGRLPAGGDHLLPAVQRPDGSRQPASGRRRRLGSGHGLCRSRRLPPAVRPRGQDGVQPLLRRGQVLSGQGRRDLHQCRRARRHGGRGPHRRSVGHPQLPRGRHDHR